MEDTKLESSKFCEERWIASYICHNVNEDDVEANRALISETNITASDIVGG